MNTSSVSAYKNMFDGNTVDTKSKTSKSEDSFKDMMKNVSSNTSNQKDKQNVSDNKDTKDAKVPEKSNNDTVDTKDEENVAMDTTEATTVLANSAAGVDLSQFKKVLNISVEGLVGNLASTNGQEGASTQGVVAATNADSMQAGVMIQEASKGQTTVANNLQTLVQNGLNQAKTEGNTTGQQTAMTQASSTNVQQNGEAQATQTATTEFVAENATGEVVQKSEGTQTNTVTDGIALMQPKEFDGEVITIKVGETSLNSSWEQAAKEIGEMIVQKINDDVQKVNVTLNPEGLGEIDVEFLMDKGKIAISLICNNEATKTLLASNLDSLSKVVQAGLMQEVNVNITFEKADGENANNENFDGSGNNAQYQQDSQDNKENQDAADADFLQKLRLGIENFEGVEI